MSENIPTLYTVGHSNHSIGGFIEILKSHQIEAIADVRSSPYSKYTPQFNRETLKQSLKDSNIRYVFLGKELGARREEPECYENNKVVYKKVTQLPSFADGIDRLQDGVKKMRIAIMCAEKDPLECHRVLIAHFSRSKFDVTHILGKSQIKSQDEVDEEVLQRFRKKIVGGLLDSKEKQLDDAYTLLAEKIAYREVELERVELEQAVAEKPAKYA